MFERYTEKAGRVIFFARYEASQFGDLMIGDTHLLLGLLREDKSIFPRLLAASGTTMSVVEVDAARSDLRRRIEEAMGPPRQRVSTSVDMPLTDLVKRILAYAAEEAESMGHRHLGTEHILLGILREEGCAAASVLQNMGITLAKTRELIASSEPSFEASPGVDAGIAYGRTGGFVARARGARLLEFVCDEKVMASVMLTAASAMPRIGERVVLKGKRGGEDSYRVENLTYIYEPYSPEMGVAPHQLAKVVVRLVRE